MLKNGGEKAQYQRTFIKHIHFIRAHAKGLALLNLLILLCALIVVALPAALVACAGALMHMLHKGALPQAQAYRRVFQARFFEKLIACALLLVLPVLLACWPLFFGEGHSNPFLFYASLLLALTILGFFCPIMAVQPIGAKKALQAACFLICLEWKKALLLLLFIGIWVALSILLFPYTLLLLLPFGVSLPLLFACGIVKPLIDAHMRHGEIVSYTQK